jgi:P-type Mg2+ transporter
MIRTRKLPFLESWPSGPLLISTLLISGIAVVLPFSRIGSAIGLVELPGIFFVWLGAILLAYGLAVQAVKIWFLRHFKSWI